MDRRTFRLVGLDEGRPQQSNDNDNVRLVCLIADGGKLAIWGKVRSTANIDAVRRAGMPCTVECECVSPEPWARKYGHTFWVPQGAALKVVADSAAAS